jgi:hypothetical protein
MWESVKKWFVQMFMTKYMIVRNGLLLWQVFYPDRTETKYCLAKSELLSKLSFLNDFAFSRYIKRAYTSNGVMSFILIKFLIWKHGRKFRFRRIKAIDIVFVSDLTGITEN